jgi:hypothetical protein
MNEQQLLALLEEAQAALDDGASMHEINGVIREETGGVYPGMMSLGLALGPDALKGSSNSQIVAMGKDEADADPESALQQASTVSPFRDFAESGLQGITFGAAENVLGEGFSERLENRREVNPGASLIAESAGLLIPGAGIGSAALRLGKGAKTIQATRAAKAAAEGTKGVTRASRAAQTAREAKAARTALAATRQAGSGTGTFRKAGVLAGATGLESAALAAGEADAGRDSVSLRERGAEALKGFAIGAPFGMALGVAGPVLRGVGRLLRSDDQLARLVAQEAVEQTAKTPAQLFDAVRRRATQPGGTVSTLADASPELAVQATRFASGGTGKLRRLDGPLEALRGRVAGSEIENAKRAIYAPFDNLSFDEPHLIKALTKAKKVDGKTVNSAMLDATREVVKGPLDKVDELNFKQLQSIRNRLKAQFDRASGGGFIEDASNIKEAQFHLDEIMENMIPGYQSANSTFIELLSRQKGAEELIRAIDKALPTITPEVPSFGGLFASTYKTVGRPGKRRQMIVEMVGEALLADGEEGIARLQRLLRQGKIAQLFSGLDKARHVGSKALRAQPGGLINPESDRF